MIRLISTVYAAILLISLSTVFSACRSAEKPAPDYAADTSYSQNTVNVTQGDMGLIDETELIVEAILLGDKDVADFETRFSTSDDNMAAAPVSDNGIIHDQSVGTADIELEAEEMIEAVAVNIVDLNEFTREVFRLTNIERANAGIAALVSTGPLNRAAMMRAQEATRNFSHDRPGGSSFYTVFGEFGIDYRTAGENIAMGQRTPSEVVSSWMNSTEHRSNILNSRFGHMGVGVVIDSNGRLYWVQVFTN